MLEAFVMCITQNCTLCAHVCYAHPKVMYSFYYRLLFLSGRPFHPYTKSNNLPVNINLFQSFHIPVVISLIYSSKFFLPFGSIHIFRQCVLIL